MSVDKTTYILYGTRIEYEEYKKIEEQHEDDFGKKFDFVFLA